MQSCPNGCGEMERLDNLTGKESWKGWICHKCETWLRDLASLPKTCTSSFTEIESGRRIYECELLAGHRGQHQFTEKWD